MKQVFAPVPAIAKIIGSQPYHPEQGYRTSRYCLAVPCEDGTLLYHTLTGELLLKEPGETEAETREQLVRGWFMVPDSFDEYRHAEQVKRIASMLQKKKTAKTSFTILTTTDCNARCFYCYEMGCRRVAMTPETAKDIGAYISRVCGGEKVRLSWFGGEPLYNPEVIDIICEELRKRDVSYRSILTSNGYFLDAETARKAKRDWHVESVQITLDGTEQVYNRTKAYVHAVPNPYQRVLENINSLLDEDIIVFIRLNMDQNNAEDLYTLCGELSERFGRRDNLFVHVILLHEFAGPIHSFDSEDQAIAYYRRIQDRLDALGLGYRNSLPREWVGNHCMADNDGCEVLLPEGRVGICEHFSESEITGTIYDEKRDYALRQTWKETMVYPACETCLIFPRCFYLKKCEWNNNGCSESRRYIITHRLKGQVLKAYLDEKNRTEEQK